MEDINKSASPPPDIVGTMTLFKPVHPRIVTLSIVFPASPSSEKLARDL